MTNSLKDLLAGRMPSEPPEVMAIKKFIEDKFDEKAAVTVTPQSFVIRVRGSAFAGALRPHLFELKDRLKTEKKLVIRIE